MRGKSLLRFKESNQSELLPQWLCHSDARQVFDLPTARALFHRVYDPAAVIDRTDLERPFRQVIDLPRIRVAKPSSGGLRLDKFLKKPLLRASATQTNL
jgi:hypothetical protein